LCISVDSYTTSPVKKKLIIEGAAMVSFTPLR
jgi:hypothetical protein